jgi:hypothetical protein
MRDLIGQAVQFTTVRNLIKALLTKRKFTGNFLLKLGQFKGMFGDRKYID